MPTIRQQIISDEAVRNLLKEMGAIPQRALDARDTLDKVQFELYQFESDKQLQIDKDVIEAEHSFLVREEKAKDADGKDTAKLLYTNEKQREQATLLACQKDEAYIKVQTEILARRTEHGKLKMNVGKHLNTLKYITAQSYMYGDMAKVVAGLSLERPEGKIAQAIQDVVQFSNLNNYDEGDKNV